MRKVRALSLIATLILSFGEAVAAPAIDAHVLYAGMYGDGTMFVFFDTTINEPGCIAPEIRIVAGNAQIKTWLAIALTAAAAGTTVRVQTDACYMSRPSLTTVGSYLFLWAPT